MVKMRWRPSCDVPFQWCHAPGLFGVWLRGGVERLRSLADAWAYEPVDPGSGPKLRWTWQGSGETLASAVN